MATQHKVLEKLWDSISKENFKSNGWNHSNGFTYTSINNHLYDFVIIKHRNKPNTISADLNVKFIPLDDILWTILKMENNSKARFSLRVSGAFCISSKSIESWQQEISLTNPEEDFAKIFERVDRIANDYSKKLIDIDTFLAFVLQEGKPKNMIDKNLYLTGLIYKNEIAKAIAFLKENIKTETGGFCIGKDNFYQLALQYCKNRALSATNQN